ncbi:MAG: hypothetical protein E7290_10540 [Lachnospiraceae bacterium]|nr:hypothetical protein [Lachnospiraceae bacterium]
MQLQDIFLQIVNMSLMAAVIIVAILGIRQVMRRAPKVFSYMLWLVVLFRLLCPISFSTELSLFRVLDWNASEDGRVEIITDGIIYVEDKVVKLDAVETAYITSEAEENFLAERSDDALLASAVMEDEVTANIMNKDVVQKLENTKEFESNRTTWMMRIWLAGFVVISIYSIVQMLILRRNLIGAVPYKENIYYADHISSPFVLGVIRPKIYVPSSVEKSEWDYIIMHERHHIRRCDHIVRILAFGALCVHWFNPLVWIAFLQSGKDMEMSCDEAVMRQMKQDIRAEYSESLLRLATGRRYMTAMPLSFGEGDTKGRVKNVMRYKKPTLWVMVGAVVLCVVAVVILAGNPPKEKQETVSQEVESQEQRQEEQIEEVASADAVYVLADMDFELSDWVSVTEEDLRNNSLSYEPLSSASAGEKGFAIEIFEPDYLWMMDGASYYYPSHEDQLKMWELLRGIGWTVDDDTKPWLSMKETGWKIRCNQQTFMVFEGGYIYWEKAEQGTETKRYFGQSIELCDMIQQELSLRMKYEPIDPREIVGIKSLAIENDVEYGFAKWSLADPETMALFERWFQDAEYIWGGVDCEMTNLKLGFEHGMMNLAIATEGSPIFAINGVFYNFCPMEYRERGDWDMEDFKMYFEPIPEQVKGEAKNYVQEQFELYGEGYSDWRIEDLRYQYTYDDFNGMKLQIYRFNYEFLANNPDEVELVGGMEMDEEGWVVPGYPNSHHLIFEEKDGKLKFLGKFGANDCYPGDAIYTSDLQNWWDNRNN